MRRAPLRLFRSLRSQHGAAARSAQVVALAQRHQQRSRHGYHPRDGPVGHHRSELNAASVASGLGRLGPRSLRAPVASGFGRAEAGLRSRCTPQAGGFASRSLWLSVLTWGYGRVAHRFEIDAHIGVCALPRSLDADKQRHTETDSQTQTYTPPRGETETHALRGPVCPCAARRCPTQRHDGHTKIGEKTLVVSETWMVCVGDRLMLVVGLGAPRKKGVRRGHAGGETLRKNAEKGEPSKQVHKRGAVALGTESHVG